MPELELGWDEVKIGCLGWGSLIWDPRELPVRSGWFEDGPLLPIEFSRESKGQRITLVLVEGVASVRSLWALMAVDDLEQAKQALADREGMGPETRDQHIGYWRGEGASKGVGTADIAKWAEGVGLDGVVWTALPPSFKDKPNAVMTPSDVVGYVRDRKAEARRSLEEYVRRAPPQIDTEVRRRLEMEFGWTSVQTGSGT